jgi:hypothetical protein
LGQARDGFFDFTDDGVGMIGRLHGVDL